MNSKLQKILQSYTDSEIAKVSGINRAYIWLIRKGKRKPKTETIDKIVSSIK
jgi:transcriptional regulator with XRE-family HTH domain